MARVEVAIAAVDVPAYIGIDDGHRGVVYLFIVNHGT